jgi:hypothetical protein
MSENNPPADAGTVDDAPLSINEGVENLTSLLADPETDLPTDQEDEAIAEADDGEDPDVDVSEDVDPDEAAEDSDGPQDADIKGGRFAPDTAKVTLEDGTVISVADLKRNNLFQRDYTRKTQELAQERDQIQQTKSTVDQQAQTLMQLADKLNSFGQRYLPQPPQPFTGSPETDPIGYMRHMQERDAYEQAVSAFNAFDQERAQLQQQAQYQTQTQTQQLLQAEFATLREKDKLFADPAKARSFLEEAVEKGNEWWGLTPDDIGTLTSHKAYLILRDAMRYRKALARAPEAQKQVEGKPILPRQNRRVDPRARASQDFQQRSERLRKTGSIDDAVELLKSLNL